jgi:hypothetical protein
MSNKSPKSLSELIFQPGGPLHELARRADAATDLASALRSVLAPALAAELRSASLQEDGTLVVTAGSSAWAARLRYEAGCLLARCRETNPAAQRLEVRVSAETKGC